MADASDQPPAEPSDRTYPATSVGPLFQCPNCEERMPAEAVLCVHCGFNVRTGTTVGAAGEPEEETRSAIALPVRGIIVLGVVVAALGAAWFFVGKPIVDGLKVDYALAFMTDGSLQKALDRFEELRPKVGRAARERCDLRIAQLKLESEKNRGATMSQGVLLTIGAVDMTVERDPSVDEALLCKLVIRNNGDEPLTLKEDYFYLRGSNDITLPTAHEDSSVEGRVVRPGGSRETLIAFTGTPMRPAMVRVGIVPMPCFYLFLNDGEMYVKRLLPP